MTADLDRAKTAFLAGRLQEAEALMRAAWPAAPAMAANDLGGLLVHAGRPREGVGWLLKALELSPRWVMPRYNLGVAFLGLGLAELGWILLEARRGIAELQAPSPDFPFPEWRGERLAGRHIVIVGEQGAGDQIMFARYVPVLEAQGAQVTYVCHDSLAGVLPSSVAGVARTVAADFWAPMMSLPHRLGPQVGIPAPAAIAIRSGSGGGVGVMAAGSPTHINDLNRSLKGDDAERLLALGRDLSQAATGAATFRDTAEIIAGLDLVISVDTAVAHLAASMGKPTWMLIPALGVDWRWGWAGETTLWYPSARLYRQPKPADWTSVLDRIERDLKAREP